MNTPGEIAKNYLLAGAAKARLPLGRMFLLAVLAGAYIGLAGLGATVASAGAGSAGAGRLLSACVFPAGLTMVLLAGSELFTGNCLILIPVLQGEVTPAALARNLVVVYLGNALGGFLVAAGAVYSRAFDLLGGGVAAGAISTAAQKCALGPVPGGAVQPAGLSGGLDGHGRSGRRRQGGRPLFPHLSLCAVRL